MVFITPVPAAGVAAEKRGKLVLPAASKDDEVEDEGVAVADDDEELSKNIFAPPVFQLC